MKLSSIQAIGAVCLALATTTAGPSCSKDTRDAASMSGAVSANSASLSAPTAGPGLPADFPIAPGLSPCKPVDASGEIICEWHNVNGHAIYTFYHDALPKAGYTILPGAQEVTASHYMGAIGFKKGSAKGAVSIAGGDLTIQYLPHA